jgi:catechol 2,3-dioxygenase-like lactoylglutathione lyase family enzyme
MEEMLTNIRNLDYVVLLCNDTARMKAFYHGILGFPIYRDWEDWIEMRVGAVLLTLRTRGRPYDGRNFSARQVFSLLSALHPLRWMAAILS